MTTVGLLNPPDVLHVIALAQYLVQRLKVLCPSLGKQKIAQGLCRAGLHLSTTTVGTILKGAPKPAEKQAASLQSTEEPRQAENVPATVAKRVITAGRINHVWYVDPHA